MLLSPVVSVVETWAKPSWTAEPALTAIAGLAAAVLGDGCRIVDGTVLSPNKDEIQVARLMTEAASGEQRQVIAKCLLIDDESSAAVFAEESACYEFLMTLRERFAYFPELLGSAPQIFLLDDLGADDYEFADGAAAHAAIARTLALLHQATQGREDDYHRIRASRGLPPAIADRRAYGPAGCFYGFAQGEACLNEWCAILLPHAAPALAADLRRALQIAAAPGDFLAFVHDDFAHRRQSVVHDGVFKLIDFEAGKFFHRLTDISTILVGKLERRFADRRFIHLIPEVPDGFADQYREAWRDAGGAPPEDDAVWRTHVTAMLIFQGMMALAQIRNVVDREFAVSVPAAIRSVLRLLAGRLAAYPETAATAGILGQLASRIGG